MLTIRNEQIQALSGYMRVRFVERMAGYLRSTLPSKTREITDERLRDAIVEGITKARSCGIVAEKNVARFLEYVVVYGADFDSRPETRWAKDILANRHIDETTKMTRLDTARRNACTAEGQVPGTAAGEPRR